MPIVDFVVLKVVKPLTKSEYDSNYVPCLVVLTFFNTSILPYTCALQDNNFNLYMSN